MSSNLSRSIFISGLAALPVPLILPFAVGALDAESPLAKVLSSESSATYYLITWLFVFLAALVASQLGGSNTQTDSDDQSDHSDADLGDEGKELGTVKWFNVNKGFGFITTESGEDIFVHFRSIRGRGRRSLRQGQSVRFDTAKGEKGLQAENVSVAK